MNLNIFILLNAVIVITLVAGDDKFAWCGSCYNRHMLSFNKQN